MVLVPGFSAAVSAPLFFLRAGRFDRRSAILALGMAVLVSNVLVAVAPSFAVVLIGRVLFGATLGAFWTVVAPVGPKLVGPAGGTRAITIIAAVTLLVVVAQTVVLPSMPPDGRTQLRYLAPFVPLDRT
jgi:predicted MFS family arabinose efflux permease